MTNNNGFRITFTYTVELIGKDGDMALDRAQHQYSEGYRDAEVNVEPIMLFRCTDPDCGGDLMLEQRVEAERTCFIDEKTGLKMTPEDIAPGYHEVTSQILKCSNCGKVFNHQEDNDGNVIYFNDDLF